MVLEAILMGRQPHEKLQFLCENLMLNTFRKMAVLKNMNIICNYSFTPKDSKLKKLSALPMLELLF